MGFESGADDYVTKPFSLVVLMRRIDTLLQRGATAVAVKRAPKNTIEIDGFIMDLAAYVVRLDGEIVDLTYKEFKILRKLCSALGRVYSREQLLDELWGNEYVGDIRTVDSHMARIRTKLGAWATRHMVTIYGSGYKIEK
jgi:DNA-binding response OmpR family regulator